MQAAPSCRPTYLFTINTIIRYAIRLHRENWLGQALIEYLICFQKATYYPPSRPPTTDPALTLYSKGHKHNQNTIYSLLCRRQPYCRTVLTMLDWAIANAFPACLYEVKMYNHLVGPMKYKSPVQQLAQTTEMRILGNLQISTNLESLSTVPSTDFPPKAQDEVILAPHSPP